jgi:hypothetical protein
MMLQTTHRHAHHLLWPLCKWCSSETLDVNLRDKIRYEIHKRYYKGLEMGTVLKPVTDRWGTTQSILYVCFHNTHQNTSVMRICKKKTSTKALVKWFTSLKRKTGLKWKGIVTTSWDWGSSWNGHNLKHTAN